MLRHAIALASLAVAPFVAANPAAHVPAQAPRTMVLAGRHDAFREYCTTGAGAAAFARIKEDFDRDYLTLPFPDEPVTYGDPSPTKRTSDIADKWRDVQDVCGVVSGVAEAATLCWIVTGEEKYLAKAKEFLLASCRWHLAPDWRNGPVVGATDIEYNDEGHFRLWRKLPLVYDQLREQFTPEERKFILDHFRERGNRSVSWIERTGGISKLRKNSIEGRISSHPVRFMPMTGITALALWDDLPESREWWAFAYRFYKDQFTPWGGDDGGWAEGVAYWRGTLEHAFFQDALLAMGDPQAYSTPFWKNTPYFQIYNVQPYLHTQFGDLSNAGKFNLESGVAEFLLHISRVTQDGYIRAYADLCIDKRRRPADAGLKDLDRRYPTAAEFILRNFTSSHLPLPAPKSLGELPAQRWFKDVGWVSMHSALGQPSDDIHITFVSSPYGSFSHSHAHQNAFVLNAYGQGLAVNSGFREWHNSPHHEQWVRQTLSKNAILIDGAGQKPRSKAAVGRIVRFEQTDRATWTTGDATEAYAQMQPKGRVVQVLRDLVFVDRRYVVIRDHVKLATPGKISWLLHTERQLLWAPKRNLAFTCNGDVTLTTKLIAPYELNVRVTEGFAVEVDPKYTTPGQINYSSTGEWNLKQNHLSATSTQPATEHVIYSVLWPEKNSRTPSDLDATVESGVLTVNRPDGKTDRIRLDGKKLSIN